ncbi:ankyrin repeat domain-containing protein [Planctomycetota bacterium]
MGNIEIAKLLLQKGADHSAKNAQGLTPLDTAKSRNHKEVVDLLTAEQSKKK